jgi:hypothetical protein
VRLVGQILLSALVAGCAGVAVMATTTTEPTTTTSTAPTTTTTAVPPVTVTGAILDGGGRPVVGVEVAFGDGIAFSGTDGLFSVSTVDPGPITATKSGWRETEIAWSAGLERADLIMTPIKVRGLRVGAGAAADEAHFQRLLGLAEGSAVNTLVFDTKQEGGRVMYDTSVPEAHRIGAVDVWYDPVERIAQARVHDLYTITRVAVFEDAFWTRAHPDEKLVGPWVDPTAPGARRYNIDLAVEACALGFDEVQFDYVRFPAGRTAQISGHLDIPQEERVQAVAGFLAEARSALEPMGCMMSADIFAIVVSVENDQGLGQRPEELSSYLDALSPMIYPSHYSPGWLGYLDPNDHPYAVTANAIDAALPRVPEGTALRPWLQAFSWTDSQIRMSIQAAEDRDVGWILWNVGGVFSDSALPGAGEVTD